MEGVRILDLTAFWAGPHATAMLAALGADVIKVESARRPDPMRLAGFTPPSTDCWWEYGPTFHGANPGKRGITLDLEDPAGRAALLRLVRDADVVIENFTPRVLDNFGIDFETLTAERNDVILVRMPAFGLDGPWRDIPGFAPTIESAIGLATITGYEGGRPVPAGGVADPFAGALGAFAVIGALRRRDCDGAGQLVEVPMAEVGLSMTAVMVAEHEAYGEEVVRRGSRSTSAVPQGVFRCADMAWVAVSVQDDSRWRSLARCTGVGGPDWTLGERWSRRDDLEVAFANWCVLLPSETVLATLHRCAVAAAEVRSVDDLDDDEDMRARGFWQALDHEIIGRHDHPVLPFTMGVPVGFDRPAPLLGQHTREVLVEHGFTDDEISELERAGVTATLPAGL